MRLINPDKIGRSFLKIFAVEFVLIIVIAVALILF